MPLRICVDNKRTILDMVKMVNSELTSCFFNQKYPYDLLVQDLQLAQRGIQSLFQVCVNYYNTKLNSELNGLRIENNEFYNGNQTYSLQLVVKDWSDSNSLTLDFDYKISDYTNEQIEEMYSCMMKIIEWILVNPDMQLSGLTLLSEQEKNELVYSFNSTEKDYPKSKTIVQLFEEQVEKTPNRIAVSFGKINLTYEELNERSNQTAHFLREKGVCNGKIVGLMVTHSLEMVVGILAVIKAGGAYLPIDSEYPSERISYMLNDSGASLLLTNCKIDNEIEFNGQIVKLNDYNITHQLKSNPYTQNHPSDAVYVIYTSGSTGKPKGVIIEHQGLVNYIWWARKMYVKDDEDIFALYSSLSFDLTVTSVFTPLINGNRIVVYSQNEGKYVLYRVMSENKVNIIKLTPSHLSLITELDNSNSSVKRFIVGGEDLKVSLAESVYKSFNGNIEIYNEYGPTETVVGCMIYKYDYEKDRRVSVPIGIPADNVQIYILDEDLNPVSKGKTGEMYISGDGVARGYLNRTDLTNQRFVANPFLEDKRMYRTGDLARYLDSGVIEYVGRADHQVKIRGYRIELGEIEEYLLKYDSIDNAVVIDQQYEDSSTYLCAYVVSSKSICESEIRQYLSRFLPDYMVPTYINQIDEIPLSSNGKVDRKFLRQPQRNVNKTEYRVPVNEYEIKLVESIEAVLGIKNIGLRHNFFHIGGDSIKAIQIASRLNEAGLKITVKDILSNPVIEDMAVRIEVCTGLNSAEQGLCEGIVEKTPVSSWFLASNFKNADHYNQSVLLKFNQEVHTERLKGAFEQLVRHHDSLRLNFDTVERKLFYNNSYLKNEFDIEEFDLSIYSDEMQTMMMNEMGEKLKSSFNIARGILIKACVFNLGKSGKRLLVTAHHLVIDGVSWRIILDDLQRILECQNNFSEDMLPLKTHSMQKWAETLKEYSMGEVLKETEYWNSILQRNFTFPLDFNPIDRSIEKVASLVKDLTRDKTENLLTSANISYGTETVDILVAALVMAVCEFTGEEEIIIELEGHGRQIPVDNIDISRTVGWFTSMYPVALRGVENSIEATIKSVKEQLRKIPNKGVGFGILKYLSETLENLERKYIRFNYLGDFDNTFDGSFFSVSNEKCGNDISVNNQMTCLVDINAIIVNKKLEIRISYNGNCFKERTMLDFSEKYLSHIVLLIEHCCNKESRDFTPSDFDAVEILQADLDGLFS